MVLDLSPMELWTCELEDAVVSTGTLSHVQLDTLRLLCDQVGFLEGSEEKEDQVSSRFLLCTCTPSMMADSDQ